MHIDIHTREASYRDQLDRVRRFLKRVQNQQNRKIVEYLDDVYAFFQNCWHLKDWIRNDVNLPVDVKHRIVKAAHQSRALSVCRGMANGTKHLELNYPQTGSGAAISFIRIDMISDSIECAIDVYGRPARASAIAEACLGEWEKILTTEGLSTETTELVLPGDGSAPAG